MLRDAENAIDKAQMWEYMKGEPGEGGYMFGSDAELKEIYSYITYDGHSGSSMAWTMRVMQELARLGIDEFCARRGQRIAPEIKEPVRQARTLEMDSKVIDAYNTLKAFQRPPKWASDYATLYPACVANLKFE